MDGLALLLAVIAVVLAWRGRRTVATLRNRLGALEGQIAALRAGAPDLAPGSTNSPPGPDETLPFGPPPGARGEPAPEPIDTPSPRDEAADASGAQPAPPPIPPLREASASPPPPPQPPPVERTAGFEERFGTRWVVWIGGVALALGGVFLVRFSIEQGWIGPGVRVALGGLLALALMAAGEWMRRKDIRGEIAEVPAAHVPGVLTAAGAVTAYATVYAAYALYAFLGPGAAFVLLGATALATLAAALLQGPALAGLGLVGAYVTPILVASDQPNFPALYLYLAVVTAAAFALARLRRWRWLAIAAVALSALWSLPGVADSVAGETAPLVVYLVTLFGFAAVIIVAGLAFGPDALPDTADAVSSSALAAYLVPAALAVVASGHDSFALAGFMLLAGATVAIAWRTPAAIGAVPVAAALAALTLAAWAITTGLESAIAPAGPLAGFAPEPARASLGLHLFLGAGSAALFGASGFLKQGRAERPVISIVWAACAVATPIAVLIALYWRIAAFDRSIPFAGLALLLAAAFATATEALSKRAPRPGLAAGGALFAVGCVASLALALTMALEKGWLTIALALLAPGVAFVERRRALPMLRWLAAAASLLTLARIGWEPRIVGDAVGATPIFNWLLYGYGVPAAGFWAAGRLLRKRADDIPSRVVDSLAILFTVLLATLEIRHFVHGDIYRAGSALTEVGLQVCAWLAIAIGLERLRARTGNIVHNVSATLIAGLALAAVALGLMLFVNPFFTGEPVGGPVINLVLLGYGLPAALAATLALVARNARGTAYRVVIATAAVALALAWLSLEIRRFFHGPVLTVGPTTDLEQYAYSAAWLVFGVLLLLVGILLRSQWARLASAAVVMLTIGKVFLHDMADLEGIYRALSFIGLGLVLVGIGLLYQRLLFPPPMAAGKTPGADDSGTL